MKKVCLLFLVVLIFQPALVWAEGLSAIDIADNETGKQRIRFSDEKTTLYNYNWQLVQTKEGLKFTAQGDNDKQGAARIEWTESSLIEETSNRLRTLWWSKVSSGAEKETWKLTYDWQNAKASYRYEDRASGKKESKELSFGKNAYASDAMYFFLRGFPFKKGAGTTISGEFILTDGSVMNGQIIHAGEERLQTAFGEIDTYKLQFKPAGIVGAFAPKMYIWFTKNKPNIFVRYDGKDDGLLKPRTTNELMAYTPMERIVPAKEKTPATDVQNP